MSITPVARLEGRQMNRDGNITGEEGGSIGNIHDRVFGDVDNGVADVYLVAKARESPIEHASTPTPFVQHARLKSPAVTKGRLEFSTYRPEAGVPTWQQQSLHSAQPGTMHELQYRPVAASIRSQRSVIASVDVPSNAAAVELEVSGLSQEHEEALLPIIDLSEVFIPAPMVPARSLARPKTKSSAIELIQQRRPITERPTQQQRPAKRNQDVAAMQSTHILTSNPSRQHHIAHAEPQHLERTAVSTTGSSPNELGQTVARGTPRVRQLLGESASDSGKSEIAGFYSEPSMSTVPPQLEDGDSSPAHFFHKHESPTIDGLRTNTRLTPQPTLDRNSLPPSELPCPSAAQTAGSQKAATLSCPEKRTNGKKKSRFVLSFGRKTVAVQ
ncbi:hypothetical protein LTR17_027569 [Elasticomyces elasticus]|nr:hypothetical protein LTR17_027569 [Elasticomyces elasticus]